MDDEAALTYLDNIAAALRRQAQLAEALQDHIAGAMIRISDDGQTVVKLIEAEAFYLTPSTKDATDER